MPVAFTDPGSRASLEQSTRLILQTLATGISDSVESIDMHEVYQHSCSVFGNSVVHVKFRSHHVGDKLLQGMVETDAQTSFSSWSRR